MDLDLIFFNVGRPNPRDYFPLLKALPSPRVRAVAAARARVQASMEAIIADARATLAPDAPRDMLDLLLIQGARSGLSALDLQQMLAEMFIGAVVPDAMPIAWARTQRHANGKTSRVFCTTMGAATDLTNEGLRRMVVNAVFWTFGLDVPAKVLAFADEVIE